MNSLLHSIQKELKKVNQEIGNYPSPITGCDAVSYTHLTLPTPPYV